MCYSFEELSAKQRLSLKPASRTSQNDLPTKNKLIDKNRYRKSLDIIDINRFILPINIDWYRKSVEIEITEKIIYRLLSINKIDNRNLAD